MSNNPKYHAFTNWVTIITSILALIAALSSILASRCAVRGTLAKNDAILKQNKATDLWSYYQAKAMRVDIDHLAVWTVHDAKIKKYLEEKIIEVEQQKKDLLAQAREAEADRDKLNYKSEHSMQSSRDFTNAQGLLQLAVLLAPMALIVHRRRVLVLSTIIGSFGFIYFIVGCVHYIKR